MDIFPVYVSIPALSKRSIFRDSIVSWKFIGNSSVTEKVLVIDYMSNFGTL